MHRIIFFLGREKLLAAMITLAVTSLLITADNAAMLSASLATGTKSDNDLFNKQKFCDIIAA